RSVLHLEPDEAVVLTNLAIEFRVEGADGEARDLLAAEQQFLGLVVERTLVTRADVRLAHPAPAAGNQSARTELGGVCASAAATPLLCLHRHQRHTCEHTGARRPDQPPQ